MARCSHCGAVSRIIARYISLCARCIREEFRSIRPHIIEAHSRSRREFNLPEAPPQDENGRPCDFCVNDCHIVEGKVGFCGLRRNEGGRIAGGEPGGGNLSWYHDPLPTNCVADWVCPGGCGSGYPQFAHSPGPEYGYKNLAVFYQACTFNCLFCQNWHFRMAVYQKGLVTAQALAEQVDERTSCICYFGGDPTPQLAHALSTSRIALKRNRGRILRICWETNGAMNPKMLKEMARISLDSGGCIKFDLKAYSEEIHLALCGVTNKRTLENFALLSKMARERPEPPFLIASTLLVPGYVDVEEVGSIARFIASLDTGIPYSLLGFYPHFFMADLPTTSRGHAVRCRGAALSAGLKRVHIGNVHLLGEEY